MKLTDFKVLTFDCYGTLIDWEQGITENLSSLTGRLGTELSRDQILECHAWHESSQQAATPGMKYSSLLAVVHRRLAEEWGVPAHWTESLEYGKSVGSWPAFPDSAGALAELKGQFRLAILSNVDNSSFAGSNERLGVEFDAVFTAEDVGSYKPSDRNFEYMLGHLARQGIERHEILHVAESLFHDHVPAKRFGLANCWIHRRRGLEGYGATMDPGTVPETDFAFGSMAEFAAACRSERAQEGGGDSA